jgi:hypothetical protein
MGISGDKTWKNVTGPDSNGVKIVTSTLACSFTLKQNYRNSVRQGERLCNKYYMVADIIRG